MKNLDYSKFLILKLKEEGAAYAQSAENWRMENLPKIMSSIRSIFLFLFPSKKFFLTSARFGLDVSICLSIQAEIIEALERKLSDEIDLLRSELKELLCSTIPPLLEKMQKNQELADMTEEIKNEQSVVLQTLAKWDTVTKDSLDFTMFSNKSIRFIKKISRACSKLSISKDTRHTLESISSIQDVRLAYQKILLEARNHPVLSDLRSFFDVILRLKYLLSHCLNEEIIWGLGFIGNPELLLTNEHAPFVSQIYNRRTKLLMDVFLNFPEEIKITFPTYKIPISGEKYIVSQYDPQPTFLYQRSKKIVRVFRVLHELYNANYPPHFLEYNATSKYVFPFPSIFYSSSVMDHLSTLDFITQQSTLMCKDVLPYEVSNIELYASQFGISQKDIAQLLGKTPSTISRNIASRSLSTIASLHELYYVYQDFIMEDVTTPHYGKFFKHESVTYTKMPVCIALNIGKGLIRAFHDRLIYDHQRKFPDETSYLKHQDNLSLQNTSKLSDLLVHLQELNKLIQSHATETNKLWKKLPDQINICIDLINRSKINIIPIESSISQYLTELKAFYQQQSSPISSDVLKKISSAQTNHLKKINKYLESLNQDYNNNKV